MSSKNYTHPKTQIKHVSYKFRVNKGSLEPKIILHDKKINRYGFPHEKDTYEIKDEKIGEHTSELQSHHDLVCRLLLEKKKKNKKYKKKKKKKQTT